MASDDKNIVSSSSSGGIGFVGLLTIAFIVLKLLGIITWSWWWVISPLWLSALLGLSILIVIALIAVIVSLFKPRRKHK